MIFFNPVIISVLVMIILSLLNLNVILAILIAALTAGLSASIPLKVVMEILISGMGGNSETALSYVLLGVLAVAISKTGLSDILARKIAKIVKNKKYTLVLLIAFISCFSQNLIPVHIAFIPILIPTLLPLMNKLKIDRRAMACALTFGLEMPYVVLPVGFGLIFHKIIASQMIDNGINVTTNMVWKVMWVPGIGMLLGLLSAVFFTYRKKREYRHIDIQKNDEEIKMNKRHYAALIGAIAAFVVQLITKSLPLGALTGIVVMIITGAIKWNEINSLMDDGIAMMAFIAFVMLVAAGYGNVLRETGAVETLVHAVSGMMGGSKIISALVMLIVGLFVTIGIGTSFGTVPILAAIYCPLAASLGFSIPGTIALIGTAGALGDAGSPASDSTLGPTSGLNADHQHNHIWDTCVPTFIHFNIPLIIFGVIAAIVF
ncbi:Na+/H+ antiporter family protein [Clostridium aestuarii]|uniref:Na+/H+ antiporter family protein n=1 Tax=Clostridium aestuarii TaxID=338193 RepID=A0ABT4CYQ5_9CLOT|nr:Na+/H+ antiporter family protein [Clostridium aestuarii]MCY6483100.1 Na+/H+ antiporter family protein [Clostridium aestuarii]